MKIIICVLAMIASAVALDAELEQLLVNVNNRFSSRMLSEVAKENSGESVVMSGLSAMSPLALLSLAAAGESHDELLSVLGLPNDNATKDVFSLVNDRVRSLKGVDLKIANRVYIPLGNELDDSFAEVSKNVFQSGLDQLDFNQNVKAAAAINSWVENNTNHRIQDLVKPDSLGPDTRAVLVNALYFKGSWLKKFDPSLTEDRDFHLPNNKTVKVPTMMNEEELKYGQSVELDAQLLELSYEGDDASLLVVLPNKLDGLAALQEKLLDPALLEKAVANMYEAQVKVFLPKFKIETEINLKTVLQNMGVEKLFDPSKARLENLLKNQDGGLYVSDAVQKAFIEVNEEGAEAAAASAYIVQDRLGIVGSHLIFEADKPFMFYLKHKALLLFSGSFNN